MSKTSARQRVWMSVLAIGLIALWLSLREDPGSLKQVKGDTDIESVQFGDPPTLRLDLLDSKTAPYDPRGRNLFGYYEPRRPVFVVKTSQQSRITPGPTLPKTVTKSSGVTRSAAGAAIVTERVMQSAPSQSWSMPSSQTSGAGSLTRSQTRPSDVHESVPAASAGISSV